MISHRCNLRTLIGRLVVVWLAILYCVLAPAQDGAGFDRVLDEAREELTKIERAVPKAPEDAELLQLKTNIGALQERVQAGSAAIGPQLDAIQARLAELGAAPESGTEPGDVAAQRSALEKQRALLDGQAKLAALLLLEAEQTLTDIAVRRRALFQEQLTQRGRSPLGRRFWNDLAAELPRDTHRVMDAAGALQATIARVPFGSWVVLLLSSLVTLVARFGLNRTLLRVMPEEQSHSSLRAFTYVVLWTIASALIARWLMATLVADTEPSRRVDALFNAVVACAGFGAYILALGATLLGRCAASSRWDVLPAPIAARLRGFPLAFATVLVTAALLEQLATTIGITLPTSVALEALLALLVGAVLAIYLYRLAPRQFRQWGWHSHRPEVPDAASLPIWAGIAIALSWVVLGFSALCVLWGYVALGDFIVKQFSWALIVVCSALLVANLAATLITRLLTPKGIDLTKYTATSRIASARLQAAVLFSAIAQIAIGFFALLMLLAPYGAGPAEFLDHVATAQQGISIGQLHLRPGALARAIVVLVLGFTAVRLTQRWMRERYLPLTRMDAGMRDTVASLTTYVGYVIVVALALSALGVNLQQIAWIASALAVGIGFGLQAIVQNFVSGLILLAERPVRVGDWVSLGDIEGDVRRIHARATEIQKGDRSTVIVPNSEFITKSVRNVTYNSPLGLVQIKLPMPLGTDVERVRSEMLEAFRSHPDVLKDPAPNVFLDAIDVNSVVFNATAFVRSPRMSYGVRSAVLFDMLTRLRGAGIAMSKPTTVVMEKEKEKEKDAEKEQAREKDAKPKPRE